MLIQREIFQGPWGYRKLPKWLEIQIQFFLLWIFILISLIISWMMLERLVKRSCSGQGGFGTARGYGNFHSDQLDWHLLVILKSQGYS